MEQPTKISAIICEYNPFHNGHLRHVEQTRSTGATHIVAVMSGNFVQRGEPALLSKWERARMALLCGADLVVELPTPWAAASAEFFAGGAVSLIKAMGCVDTLSFGSESGDVSLITAAAQAADTPSMQNRIKEALCSGCSYAAAKGQAAAALYGAEIADVFTRPNDTLAVEYLRALRRVNAGRIRPVAVKRTGPCHDAAGVQGGFASAGTIRDRVKSGQNVMPLLPAPAFGVLQEALNARRAPADLIHVERAILARLRCMTKEELHLLPDCSEGLENRIFHSVRRAASLEELLYEIKTKRYTFARIKRIILASFLGITRRDMQAFPPYLKVLGLNARGAEILRRVKQTGTLPVYTRASALRNGGGRIASIYQLECRATDLYSLMFPQVLPCGLEMTAPLVRIASL
jgi:predicted nucleotidyltransferase